MLVNRRTLNFLVIFMIFGKIIMSKGEIISNSAMFDAELTKPYSDGYYDITLTRKDQIRRASSGNINPVYR